MRFSIEWLLGATAYVALVVGAVVSRNDLIAGTVLLATLCAVCYAAVVACTANEKRAMALGFASFAAGNIACLYLAPERVPAMRLLYAFGYRSNSAGGLSLWETAPSGPNGGRTTTVTKMPNSKPLVRVSNAVGTLFAGLIGAGMGALATRIWQLASRVARRRQSAPMHHAHAIRLARITASVACLAVATVFLTLWIRSYGAVEIVKWTISDTAIFSLLSAKGRVYTGVANNVRNQKSDWFTVPHNRVRGMEVLFEDWGFNVKVTNRSIGIIAPYWFLIMICAAVGAIPWLKWHFSLRTLMIVTTLIEIALGVGVAFR